MVRAAISRSAGIRTGADVIHSQDGSQCPDGWPRGEDRAALSWQARRVWPQREGQPAVLEAVLWIVRRAVHGATCRGGSATGARLSGGGAIGGKPMFSDACSMCCRMILTWNTPWSMPRSPKSTAMVRAQKGDSEPGHWPPEKWQDDQDPCPHQCLGQHGLLHA